MPKIELPPSKQFFHSLVSQEDRKELANMRDELKRILAQAAEHDPRQLHAKIKQAQQEHAAAPTQENFDKLSGLLRESEGDPRFDMELTRKWSLAVDASKRQAWAYFAGKVRSKMIALLSAAEAACKIESEAQKTRESQWVELVAPFVAWSAYYGCTPFTTSTDAPSFLNHCAELIRADIKRLQECRMQGTVLPQEFEEFVASSSVNVIGSLGVFDPQGEKTLHDVAPRVAKGFK